MGNLLERIRSLVARGEYRVSLHGFRELAADDISADAIVVGVGGAVALEEYADSGRGPSILVLQADSDGSPLHVVWGIQSGTEAPAVLVTAYRPDPKRWSADFMQRRR
jgi:hypothetical protein